MEIKYYETTNKYQAEALAFLGFKYYKNGFNKDTVYTFEDIEILRDTIKQLNYIKSNLKKVGVAK